MTIQQQLWWLLLQSNIYSYSLENKHERNLNGKLYRAYFMANRICCCRYNRYIHTVSLGDYAMELIERAAPFVHIKKKKADTLYPMDTSPCEGGA